MQTLLRLLHAADDEHLSRLDPSLLSDQALMEMFAAGFDNVYTVYDENENYTDCFEWEIVEVEDGIIRFVSYDGYENNHGEDGFGGRLGGSLNLQFLPASVDGIFLPMNDLHGTISPKDLRPGFQKLCLERNRLTGSLHTGDFPNSMTEIDLAINYLSGGLDMTTLPENLESFLVGNNAFTGSLHLSKLPASLKHL